jgi:hypothetical protein
MPFIPFPPSRLSGGVYTLKIQPFHETFSVGGFFGLFQIGLFQKGSIGSFLILLRSQ